MIWAAEIASLTCLEGRKSDQEAILAKAEELCEKFRKADTKGFVVHWRPSAQPDDSFEKRFHQFVPHTMKEVQAFEFDFHKLLQKYRGQNPFDSYEPRDLEEFRQLSDNIITWYRLGKVSPEDEVDLSNAMTRAAQALREVIIWDPVEFKFPVLTVGEIHLRKKLLRKGKMRSQGLNNPFPQSLASQCGPFVYASARPPASLDSPVFKKRPPQFVRGSDPRPQPIYICNEREYPDKWPPAKTIPEFIQWADKVARLYEEGKLSDKEKQQDVLQIAWFQCRKFAQEEPNEFNLSRRYPPNDNSERFLDALVAYIPHTPEEVASYEIEREVMEIEYGDQSPYLQPLPKKH